MPPATSYTCPLSGVLPPTLKFVLTVLVGLFIYVLWGSFLYFVYSVKSKIRVKIINKLVELMVGWSNKPCRIM
jgi:hypothetical protein